VIANTLQIKAFEQSYRQNQKPRDGRPAYSEISLGLLPQSHIYALVVICHAGAYRGDQTIVLPKFELNSYLAAIQNFKITGLFLVSCRVDHRSIAQLIADYTY
jgi:acyl-CoA synthetase (AMP-forming)/AMP-acid ligase II